MPFITKIKSKTLILAPALLIISGVLIANFSLAAQITGRSIRLSNNQAGSTGVIYRLSLNRPDNGMIGSILFELCTNDPFPGTPCTAPAGFDILNSTNIINQSGVVGFGKHASSTENRMIFSRVPDAQPSGPIVIEVDGVTNPSSIGSYYGRIQTFATDDASGTAIDSGGLAIAIAEKYQITTEVPPYLVFCAGVSISGLSCSSMTGNFLDFGELSKTSPNFATSQFVVGTNAGPGFIVYVTGSEPTAGNNVIPGLKNQTASKPGKSQFGINLTANSNPTVGQLPVGPGLAEPTNTYDDPNLFKFVNGDVIVSRPGTSNYRKFTVSYLINASKNQKPGVYVTSLLYTALATF